MPGRDDGRSDRTNRAIDRYHGNVLRALLEYVGEGRPRRLRSDEADERLVITIVVDDPRELSKHLTRFNRDQSAQE